MGMAVWRTSSAAGTQRRDRTGRNHRYLHPYCRKHGHLEGSTTGGWYVARDNVTINQRVQVQGNVYLILTDGCTLTVNGGIQLKAGNSLTIYGQSEQAGTMGRLIASITEEDASIYDAVIGGNGSDTGGNDGGAVTIMALRLRHGYHLQPQCQCRYWQY